jgi:hypothetical protein
MKDASEQKIEANADFSESSPVPEAHTDSCDSSHNLPEDQTAGDDRRQGQVYRKRGRPRKFAVDLKTDLERAREQLEQIDAELGGLLTEAGKISKPVFESPLETPPQKSSHKTNPLDLVRRAWTNFTEAIMDFVYGE